MIDYIDVPIPRIDIAAAKNYTDDDWCKLIHPDFREKAQGFFDQWKRIVNEPWRNNGYSAINPEPVLMERGMVKDGGLQDCVNIIGKAIIVLLSHQIAARKTYNQMANELSNPSIRPSILKKIEESQVAIGSVLHQGKKAMLPEGDDIGEFLAVKGLLGSIIGRAVDAVRRIEPSLNPNVDGNAI